MVQTLHVEVAEDRAFERVVVSAMALGVSAGVGLDLPRVGGEVELRPARVYWYRFTVASGNGSRVGIERAHRSRGWR